MSDDRLMVSVSGVRGTIGNTLTPLVACEFGAAFGAHLGAGSTVALGSDTRPSGAMIRAALSAGLLASGVNVVDLGVVTTPGCALMTRQLGAAGGVIVTASHNPSEYNGIKFLQPTGPALRAADAAKLKAIWEEKHFSFVGTDRQGRLCRDETTDEHHLSAVLGTVDVQAIRKAGFRVVLDSINGAGCRVTPKLFDALGVEVIHLNGTPDGNFAHRPEPIEENLTDLCAAVTRHGAVVGFAQDPDADRLVIVDELGRFIGEEYTLALAVAYALSKTPGPVVTNLATSRMVDDIAAATGASVFRSPTGEANVVELMESVNAVIGGEGNGGVIDPRVVLVRNSLVGIAMMLECLATTGQTVSRRVSEIPAYTMLKTKMPCPAGVAGEIAAKVEAEFAGVDGATFNHEDGLRIDLPAGWVSVRESNTEPICRVMAEAADAPAAQALIDQVATIAQEIIRR
jgi:phosphomannomutase